MNPQRQRILVGHGGSFVDIDDSAQAQLAFQAAVDALPPAGGELFVFPPALAGDSYVFTAPVRITNDHVGLRFAPGATLDFGAGAAALFEIEGRDFLCHGARVAHSIDSAVDGRSAFLVRDVGQLSSSASATFEACRFELTQNTGEPIVGFSCIRVEGLDSKNRKGLLVDGCSFLLHPGPPQAEAWTPAGEPTGVCCVRAFNSQGNLITRNRFLGASDAAPGRMGPALCLDSAPETVIASNRFRHLALPLTGSNDPRQRSTLVRLATQEQEGHHTLVTGNSFEELDCEYVVSATNINYDGITGNQFQHIGGGARAVLQSSGVLLVVCANGFREIDLAAGADDTAVVALDQVRDAVVSANAFVRTPLGRPAVATSADCANLFQSPSQVRSSAGA